MWYVSPHVIYLTEAAAKKKAQGKGKGSFTSDDQETDPSAASPPLDHLPAADQVASVVAAIDELIETDGDPSTLLGSPSAAVAPPPPADRDIRQFMTDSSGSAAPPAVPIAQFPGGPASLLRVFSWHVI